MWRFSLLIRSISFCRCIKLRLRGPAPPPLPSSLVVCVDVAKAEKKVGKWQTSWSSPVKKTWSYSYSYSWSWSNSWPIPESPKCKKGLCVPVQPWLKNKDTGAVNGKTLEEVCNDIRDCQTCAESPNCDWDPTYSEGCGPRTFGGVGSVCVCVCGSARAPRWGVLELFGPRAGCAREGGGGHGVVGPACLI